MANHASTRTTQLYDRRAKRSRSMRGSGYSFDAAKGVKMAPSGGGSLAPRPTATFGPDQVGSRRHDLAAYACIALPILYKIGSAINNPSGGRTSAAKAFGADPTRSHQERLVAASQQPADALAHASSAPSTAGRRSFCRRQGDHAGHRCRYRHSSERNRRSAMRARRDVQLHASRHGFQLRAAAAARRCLTALCKLSISRVQPAIHRSVRPDETPPLSRSNWLDRFHPRWHARIAEWLSQRPKPERLAMAPTSTVFAIGTATSPYLQKFRSTSIRDVQTLAIAIARSANSFLPTSS
jgi:hypothetical protein